MEKIRKPKKKTEKASPEVGACFGPRFGHSKWDRFGAEITCDNDFGGSQEVGSKRAPKKDPIPPRDRLAPQPREGGRGKGKPSQLEDWKSLKPKPPQPRGLVGFSGF